MLKSILLTLTLLLPFSACVKPSTTPTVVRPCNIPAKPELAIDPVPANPVTTGQGVFIGQGDLVAMTKYFFLIGEREKAIKACPYIKVTP